MVNCKVCPVERTLVKVYSVETAFAKMCAVERPLVSTGWSYGVIWMVESERAISYHKIMLVSATRLSGTAQRS